MLILYLLNYRNELDVFTSLLEEFESGDKKEFSRNDYIRSFASVSDNGIISDLIVLPENEDTKMILYMSGEIWVE